MGGFSGIPGLFMSVGYIYTRARKSKIQARSRIAVKPEDKECDTSTLTVRSGTVTVLLEGFRPPPRDKTFHGVANFSNYLHVKWLPDDNYRKSTLLRSYYHFQSYSFRTSVDKTQNSGISGMILLWGRLKREKQHLFDWFYIIGRFGSSFRIQIRWE